LGVGSKSSQEIGHLLAIGEKLAEVKKGRLFSKEEGWISTKGGVRV